MDLVSFAAYQLWGAGTFPTLGVCVAQFPSLWQRPGRNRLKQGNSILAHECRGIKDWLLLCFWSEADNMKMAKCVVRDQRPDVLQRHQRSGVSSAQSPSSQIPPPANGLAHWRRQRFQESVTYQWSAHQLTTRSFRETLHVQILSAVLLTCKGWDCMPGTCHGPTSHLLCWCVCNNFL